MLAIFLRTAGIVFFYWLVSGLAAWIAAEFVVDYILSCPGTECGYAKGYSILFLYHPLLWLASFVLLLVTRREPLLPILERRVYLAAPLIFLAAYAVFFVSIL